MKIYTKTGDTGQTSLIGGTRVDKNHFRIEAYGTVDELNSWMGLLGAALAYPDLPRRIQTIQTVLFTIGSHLASDPQKSKMVLPQILPEQILDLEKWMDEMELGLPALSNFILPGGHVHNAWAHVARCVCRRSERQVVELHNMEPVNPLIIQYLNRLSDFLFILARFISSQEGTQEIPWVTRGAEIQ